MQVIEENQALCANPSQTKNSRNYSVSSVSSVSELFSVLNNAHTNSPVLARFIAPYLMVFYTGMTHENRKYAYHLQIL
ncbi:MAG: hypothetical protein RL497_2313 [Pseudomonadota bacterium]|jgi:hypothetical protein